uniref:Receptor-interacting serine-threonine kinase 3 n=1 Tax=Erpetoichthys calabaricus TaxID=27687 RepID=A0A8C4RRS9_ERPCA
MALCRRIPDIPAEDLEIEKKIGSGGFGMVYKARHKNWDFTVALKILYNNGTDSLEHEASMMLKGSCQYVLSLIGMYKNPERSEHGLVMPFMENGSLENLLTRQSQLPWPLKFQIIHQVALGMNFLHTQLPKPILHLDLKPSNVLLNDSFTVQLTDFGLSEVAHSSSSFRSEHEGGTLSYMPPEALVSEKYRPMKSFDVYSFAILMSFVITGSTPYKNAFSTIVKFRIPRGDRPDISGVNPSDAEGLKDMLELMENCWHKDSKKRPEFKDCIPMTKKVFSIHKPGVSEAIHRLQHILSRMVSGETSEDLHSKVHNLSIGSSPAKSLDEHKPEVPVATGPPPQQEISEHLKPPVMDTELQRSMSKTPVSTSSNFFVPQQASPGPTHIGIASPEYRNMQYPGVNIHASYINGLQIGNNSRMIITKSPGKKTIKK